jgi:hypothetical protein
VLFVCQPNVQARQCHHFFLGSAARPQSLILHHASLITYPKGEISRTPIDSAFPLCAHSSRQPTDAFPNDVQSSHFFASNRLTAAASNHYLGGSPSKSSVIPRIRHAEPLPKRSILPKSLPLHCLPVRASKRRFANVEMLTTGLAPGRILAIFDALGLSP